MPPRNRSGRDNINSKHEYVMRHRTKTPKNTHRSVSMRNNDDITALDFDIVPDMLNDLSLTQPSRKVMRAYVCRAYRDQSHSPTSIESVIDSLPNYLVPRSESIPVDNEVTKSDDGLDSIGQDFFRSGRIGISDVSVDIDTNTTPKEPDSVNRTMPSDAVVIIIEHAPGCNDFTTGAVPLNLIPLQIPIDDHLDCGNDLESQINHMPWRILTVDSLVAIPGLFVNPGACRKILPKNFLTTNAGLARVIQEVRSIWLEGYDIDTLVLGALVKRGGFTAKDPRGSCVHPEDIESFIPSNHSFYDQEYWDTVFSYGIYFENTIYRPVYKYVTTLDSTRKWRSARRKEERAMKEREAKMKRKWTANN